MADFGSGGPSRCADRRPRNVRGGPSRRSPVCGRSLARRMAPMSACGRRTAPSVPPPSIWPLRRPHGARNHGDRCGPVRTGRVR